MGETGKRYRSQRDRDNDGDVKHQKKQAINKNDSGDGELIVYRILCPDSIIGSVIGKSGKVINSIRQETRAKVKVMDPFPGAKERVITIYCSVRDKSDVEEDDDDMEPLCPAQDALFKVHLAIANALANVADSDKKQKDKVEAHLLVPTSQSANIIGKSGATIKNLRSKTRANIKVTPKETNDPTHSCAMDFDNFVLITGGTEAVKKALYAISSIMYKFTPREDISLETSVPEAPLSIIIPSDIPIYPAGGFYPSSDTIAPPSRSVPSVIGAIPHVQDLSGYADTGSTWPVYSSPLPMVSGYGGSSQSEELTVRLLCPFDKIGRVIGKGGSSIKSVRQASGARIEVDDKKVDRDECLITITTTESSDDVKSVAVEAVLLLQEKINDNDDDTVGIRFLVPSKIIGCIIGKSGSIINEIRKRTKADVRISKNAKPKCADQNDELVEVVGKLSSVRDALVQLVLRLRDDALKDKDSGHNPPAADSLYSSGTGLSVPSALPSVPSVAPLGYDQRVDSGSGLGMLSSNSLYGYGSFSVGENGYGSSSSSYSSKLYGGMQPPSTHEMVIPANAVGKVLGKGGVNIANIRKISGAIIEILDSKSSCGDRIAQISGTPDQKHSAENLIQAFIMAT